MSSVQEICKYELGNDMFDALSYDDEGENGDGYNAEGGGRFLYQLATDAVTASACGMFLSNARREVTV